MKNKALAAVLVALFFLVVSSGAWGYCNLYPGGESPPAEKDTHCPFCSYHCCYVGKRQFNNTSNGCMTYIQTISGWQCRTSGAACDAPHYGEGCSTTDQNVFQTAVGGCSGSNSVCGAGSPVGDAVWDFLEQLGNLKTDAGIVSDFSYSTFDTTVASNVYKCVMGYSGKDAQGRTYVGIVGQYDQLWLIDASTAPYCLSDAELTAMNDSGCWWSDPTLPTVTDSGVDAMYGNMAATTGGSDAGNPVTQIDKNGDGYADDTGRCIDTLQRGINDVTGKPCMGSPTGCIDMDGDGRDDVTGNICPPNNSGGGGGSISVGGIAVDSSHPLPVTLGGDDPGTSDGTCSEYVRAHPMSEVEAVVQDAITNNSAPLFTILNKVVVSNTGGTFDHVLHIPLPGSMFGGTESYDVDLDSYAFGTVINVMKWIVLAGGVLVSWGIIFG